MGLFSAFTNQQTWSDYITGQDVVSGLDRALEKRGKDLALQISVSQEDQRLALQSGLGALGASISSSVAEVANSIEFGFYNSTRHGMNLKTPTHQTVILTVQQSCQKFQNGMRRLSNPPSRASWLI